MAARVTVDEVKEILDTGLTDPQLTAFIAAATLMVDRVAAATSGYSSSELKEIERWLAAHLATCRERQLSSQKIGEASENYQNKTDLGLDSSLYGQQVKLLEHQGLLIELGKTKASISWIGTEVTDILGT